MTHNKGVFGWCELVSRGKMMILTRPELEKLVNQGMIWFVLGETEKGRFTLKIPYFMSIVNNDIRDKGFSHIAAKDPYFHDRYVLYAVYTCMEAEEFINYYYTEKEKNP